MPILITGRPAKVMRVCQHQLGTLQTLLDARGRSESCRSTCDRSETRLQGICQSWELQMEAVFDNSLTI
ncbi:hypothetical protein ACQ4M4_17950 [Leptolyngbya sp. AN02str]|uniref:hypothetical protein n=1 Tax=Leptolyngbya sp. AN02str TaxID=3423363 RepID=UPI003D31F036